MGHRVGNRVPSRQYDPMGQGLHDAEAVPEKVPSGQTLHAVEFPGEYVPPKQTELVGVEEHEYPAVHSIQVEEPTKE